MSALAPPPEDADDDSFDRLDQLISEKEAKRAWPSAAGRSPLSNVPATLDVED